MTKLQNKIGHLSYIRLGEGSDILFCFHGFGQNKNVFKAWEDLLGKRFTLLCFDLFYHGESTRPIVKLDNEEWKCYLDEVIEKEQISDFSILGFSLGGRFAISTAISYSNQIKQLILIAPDGVFKTIWFKLATTPGIRNVFKYLMKNPDKLEGLISFNTKTRIISRYVADFVRKEMKEAENRERVYISWNNFKHVGAPRRKLISQFKQYDFEKRIILGEKDHIIQPKYILPIISKMGFFEVITLNRKHHQLLDLDVAKIILKS